jgi:predicted O-methyltransferase YrrM
VNETLKEGITNAVNSLEGWTTPERALEMAELILEHKPKIVVELGVFGGRSLIPMAMALRHSNHGGKIFGVDPWKIEAALEAENEKNREWWKGIDLEQIRRGAVNAIWAHLLDPWAVILQTSSQYAADVWAVIDILNIDGNHSEIASCRDVELYLPKVPIGGFIWMDDCDWPSTQRALRMLDKSCECLKDAKTYRLYRKR